MSTKQAGKIGNQNAVKHGGESAVKALQKGEPLRGPARQAELGVYEQLETEGRVSLVRRGAVRLEAAAQCYWSAICKLMVMIEDKGQQADLLLPKLDGYIARFGWLQSSALRAWQQLGKEEKDSDRQTLEVLLSQEVKDG